MPGRRSRKRERTRGEILAAAERLVEREPLSEVPIAALCEEADVARATFFLHFENKGALGRALEQEVVGALKDGVAARRGRVAAVYRAMADAFWARPGLSRSVIADALTSAGPGELVAEVRSVLAELSSLGRLRRGLDPELAARFWLGAVVAALGSAEGRLSREAVRDELLRSVLPGVTEGSTRLKWSPTRPPGVSGTL